jgi:hypothetical protein
MTVLSGVLKTGQLALVRKRFLVGEWARGLNGLFLVHIDIYSIGPRESRGFAPFVG